MSSPSPIFPPEIEAEILVRLPAKSLKRFATVCKQWHTLITSDPTFLSSFHSHPPTTLLLLKHPPNPSLNSPIHFSLASPQSLLETDTLPVPVTNPNDHPHAQFRLLKPTRVQLMNSHLVDGYLGLIIHLGFVNGPVVRCEMRLWNPSTNESVILPKSDLSGLFDGVGAPMVRFNSGFGCENTARGGVDYKVVRIVGVGSGRVIREVYSLRKDGWKEVGSGSGISSNMLWASENCTFLDGVGWWGVYSNERKDGFFVLGFDFGRERFRRVKVPENCVDGGEKRYHSLWLYGGVLSMSVMHFGEFESRMTRHYIWGLERGEWGMLFNIDLEGGPRRPVACLGSGELVLFGENEDEHVLYDPVGGSVRRFGVSDVEFVVVIVESLLSLTRLKGVGLIRQESESSTSSSNADPVITTD